MLADPGVLKSLPCWEVRLRDHKPPPEGAESCLPLPAVACKVHPHSLSELLCAAYQAQPLHCLQLFLTKPAIAVLLCIHRYYQWGRAPVCNPLQQAHLYGSYILAASGLYGCRHPWQATSA